ncbi:MAG: hypothetical protein Tsb0034_29240 [Ekhidna sp.]
MKAFMRWVRSYIASLELEGKLFALALLVAIPYFVSSIIFDLSSMKDIFFLILDSSLLVICLTLIVLNRNVSIRRYLINFFCLVIMAGFIFYWSSSDGLSGGGPYIFPVIAVLIILITKGTANIIFSILLVILAIAMPTDLLPVSGEATYQGLLFDFTLNLIIMAVLLIVFKRELEKEREQLTKENAKIRRLNEDLGMKSTELELYNRDVELIKKNLEVLAERHIETLEKENERIIEYSFINAHLVRAPLTNIIGLADLVEKKTDKVQVLKRSADELDRVLHKISGVLHAKHN